MEKLRKGEIRNKENRGQEIDGTGTALRSDCDVSDASDISDSSDSSDFPIPLSHSQFLSFLISPFLNFLFLISFYLFLLDF